MQILNNILMIVTLIVSLAFTFIVLITGKGDAMSGSSSVRTTFKGKAGFEDFMSRITLYLGVAFMVFTVILGILGAQLGRHG